MKLEVISDFATLLETQAEWHSFTCSVAGTTPFQLPGWLLTWWRWFGSGELLAMIFRDGGTIAGVVPCFLHEWQGARQVTLIGSGISDYLEPAIHPKRSSEVVRCLGDYLESELDWQLCNWQDLNFDTCLRGVASLNRKLDLRTIEETECRRIRLAGSFADYWAARPSSLRGNVRRDWKRAESVAKLQFGTTPEADPMLIDTLIRLHSLRWKRRGQPGTIAANDSADFLRDVAQDFGAHGMLRIFWLSLGAEVVAVILAFEHANRIFDYLTAFDPQYENLGLGRILLFEALRESFERRCEAWDFLRGNEAYKSWWGSQQVPKCRLIITRR